MCILAVLPSIPLRPRLENTHAHIKRERVSKEEERPQGQASSERECMGGWDTQADESGKACWGERERERESKYEKKTRGEPEVLHAGILYTAGKRWRSEREQWWCSQSWIE